jgi:two-component system nitrogen regulation sensor histidine kinase NtrY
LFSVIPSFFVFFTSGRLIIASIDEWFAVHIERGLASGLEVHEQESKKIRETLKSHVEILARELEKNDFENLQKLKNYNEAINKFLEQQNLKVTVYVWGKSGEKIRGGLCDEINVWRRFRQLNDRTTKSLTQDFWKKLKSMCDNKNFGCFDFYGSLYCIKNVKKYYLILVYRYDPDIRYPIIEIQNAISDYKHLHNMRSSIYFVYLCTFGLLFLLILFLSIWCAIYLARGISKPIQELLGAMASVRGGNLEVQVSSNPSSDLQSLMKGFNEMAFTLRNAHSKLAQKNRELLTIVENITPAVFLINKLGRIISYNSSAGDLINKYFNVLCIRGKKITFVDKNIRTDCIGFIRELHRASLRHGVKEFSFPGIKEIFMISVTEVGFSHSDVGIVIVVEELSNIVKMSKIHAWQDAAKQMAHEIKNPLTPIQLATQRLSRRYKTIVNNDPVFIECTNTILEQVNIIKNLIVSFSDFAAAPPPEYENCDLCIVIQEVIHLYEFGYPEISFIYKSSVTNLVMKIDRKKIQRMFVNLFDNSVRVLNKGSNIKKVIEVEVLSINLEKQEYFVEILFSDNGPGIPQEVRNMIFLPYISTEKKNMGLGLAIVHDIVSLHGGVIELKETLKCTCFSIKLPILR